MRKAAEVTGWMINGQTITLSGSALIAPNLQPSGKHAQIIQNALDAWDMNNPSPIQTIRLSETQLIPMTIPINREGTGAPVVWGIHTGHRGNHVRRSPFIRLDRRNIVASIMTNAVTVGFDATGKLACACPGSYAPPLPWDPSLESSLRWNESVEFWRHNAFVTTPYIRVMHTSANQTPPVWW